MAPFLDDGSVLQQKKTWVAADYRLQRSLVCDIEGIFCSSYVLPVLDGFLRTSRKAEKPVAMVVGIFVNLIDIAEVAVVGKFKMWRNQEEGVAFIVNYFLGDVFSRLGISYAEVVDWRYVTFFGLNRLAVDEGPGRVGIVVYRKLLPLSVLLQDEGGIKFGLLGSFRYLHALGDVDTYMIRTEVELRKIPQTPDAHHDREEKGVVDGNPLGWFRYQLWHFLRFLPE